MDTKKTMGFDAAGDKLELLKNRGPDRQTEHVERPDVRSSSCVNWHDNLDAAACELRHLDTFPHITH